MSAERSLRKLPPEMQDRVLLRQNLCLRTINERLASRRAEMLEDQAYRDMPEGFPVYIETSEISEIIRTVMNHMTDEEVHEAYFQQQPS